MYIRTDDKNNIIGFAFVGGLSGDNVFEIETIPEDIIDNIFDYKYINSEFIKRETIDKYQENIETIRAIKIEQMNLICHSLIEQGVDIGESHYSLTNNDQIELIKIESFIRNSPNEAIFYHADGEKYRQYSTEEFLKLFTVASEWITYNRTYFNLLKSEINEMTNVYDIMKINYGSPLNYSNAKMLLTITGDIPFTIPEVADTMDYKSLYESIDISMIPREA